MTTSLKLVDIGKHVYTHGNHKSKTYNRCTTRERGTEAYHEENHQTTGKKPKEEENNR